MYYSMDFWILYEKGTRSTWDRKMINWKIIIFYLKYLNTFLWRIKKSMGWCVKRCAVQLKKIDVVFAFHRDKIPNCAINRISQYPRKFSVLVELTLFPSAKWRSVSMENTLTQTLTQIRIKQDSHFLYC